MTRYEKLYFYNQNCYLPGAFGELGPRIPCCKKSLGSGFSFTTKSCRVKVSHSNQPVHVLLSFYERTKETFACSSQSIPFQQKEPNNHLPVYVLFSFATPHPDPSHQHSWIRLNSFKVKVHIEGKET